MLSKISIDFAVQNHLENEKQSGNIAMAQGKRPLWEFESPSKPQPIPLGDLARLYRQEHAQTKKAIKVLEK
jgi:hypothetical protein